MQTFNQAMNDFFRHRRGIQLKVGLRPENLFQESETDFIERWKALYQRALDFGPFTEEYRDYSETMTLLLTVSLLKRDAKVFGVSVFGKDITEQKRAAAALRESEAKLR